MLFSAHIIKLDKFVQHEIIANYHILSKNTLVNISFYGLMEYDVTNLVDRGKSCFWSDGFYAPDCTT
jgi:hypothetical protein